MGLLKTREHKSEWTMWIGSLSTTKLIFNLVAQLERSACNFILNRYYCKTPKSSSSSASLSYCEDADSNVRTGAFRVDVVLESETVPLAYLVDGTADRGRAAMIAEAEAAENVTAGDGGSGGGHHTAQRAQLDLTGESKEFHLRPVRDAQLVEADQQSLLGDGCHGRLGPGVAGT